MVDCNQWGADDVGEMRALSGGLLHPGWIVWNEADFEAVRGDVRHVLPTPLKMIVDPLRHCCVDALNCHQISECSV